MRTANPYEQRPAANRPSARLAWDILAKEHTAEPREMALLWMDDWFWQMEFVDGEYREICSLALHNIRASQ